MPKFGISPNSNASPCCLLCYRNRERLRCNGILIISKAYSIVFGSPLLVPRLQHLGKYFPLSLLTPYLLYSQWQTPHQCRVRIGLYILSSRWGLRMGYRIAKGVSEICTARLLLTVACVYFILGSLNCKFKLLNPSVSRYALVC